MDRTAKDFHAVRSANLSLLSYRYLTQLPALIAEHIIEERLFLKPGLPFPMAFY
jgi:hypothetical protein